MPESRNQAFQSTRLRNIDFDMILIRQEEKQGKARKSKERIEKARNNSGDRWRSRLTRSGLGFAGLGLDLQVCTCTCKSGLALRFVSLGLVFAVVFPCLALYLQAWAWICKFGLVFAAPGLYFQLCICRSGLVFAC